jgi:hypothetical protein
MCYTSVLGLALFCAAAFFRSCHPGFLLAFVFLVLLWAALEAI